MNLTPGAELRLLALQQAVESQKFDMKSSPSEHTDNVAAAAEKFHEFLKGDAK